MNNTNSITQNNNDETTRLKRLVTMSLFSAIAYLSVFLIKIPVSFLTLDIKDAVITVAGLILGPVPTLIMSFVVSLVEMITISDTGPIGAFMNFISTVSFAVPVSIIYRKHKSVAGILTGLISGNILMTALMILWNYIITPYYMGVERQVVVDMIVPLLLPFNLFKGFLNLAIVMLFYRPLKTALSGLHIIPKDNTVSTKMGVFEVIVYVLTIAIIIFGIIVAVYEPLRKLIFSY